MSKQYLLRFGSINPTTYSGLSPTFTQFRTLPAGTTALPPGITEIPTATGLYYCTYGATAPIAFICDGGASMIGNDRYLTGILDPADAIDQQVTGLGNTLITGISYVTSIGTTADSFGSTSVDPTTLFGYLKRVQELLEGDATFNKGTGSWTMYNRGSTTLLRTKALANNSTTVTKS